MTERQYKNIRAIIIIAFIIVTLVYVNLVAQWAGIAP